MQRLAITWLGHSTFIIRTPGGKRVLFDPWLKNNPACPDGLKKPRQLDLIVVSHGHVDHMEDLVSVARETGAAVIAPFELCDWASRKGLQNVAPMNKGGTLAIAGLRVTMTDARHSSGFVEQGQMVYMGEAAGYVIQLEDGRAMYYAGDTCLFGDMRLIGERYRPEIAFLPIGDRFTMDPRRGTGRRAGWCQADRADALGHVSAVDRNARGTQAACRTRGIQVLELKPGETAE
jgi:L-ascorbate metabolism protein UlaG (beta-lactamase superfamily)